MLYRCAWVKSIVDAYGAASNPPSSIVTICHPPASASVSVLRNTNVLELILVIPSIPLGFANKKFSTVTLLISLNFKLVARLTGAIEFKL